MSWIWEGEGRGRRQNDIDSILTHEIIKQNNCMENISCKILEGILSGIGDETIAAIITVLIQYCTVSNQCNKTRKMDRNFAVCQKLNGSIDIQLK